MVCDDTSLAQRHARELRKLADLAGTGFEVWDLTDVPLETCLERNMHRFDTPAWVEPADVADMHQRYLAGKSYPLPLPDEPAETTDRVVLYAPQVGAATAVMVDIDGTAAIMCGRSPYDETRVHEDQPNRPCQGRGHRPVRRLLDVEVAVLRADRG